MKTLFPRILGGWIFLFAFHAFADVHYVSLDSTNPEPPYLTWATAATNIQDAIDASTNGDTVLVTNGIYDVGQVVAGPLDQLNRVAITNAISVQSVNGPWETMIEGEYGTRCVYLTNNATLNGFSLELGNQTGAAVYCANSSNCVVENCVMELNNGVESVVFNGALNNCLITGNSAIGGSCVDNAVLNNCTIISNSVQGIAFCLLTNCIIYYNSTGNGTPRAAAYCCTIPLPSGPGNFTNAPDLFADGVHLAYGSPCIGAGTNAVTSTDIFGQPWAHPPSIGCAEYSPAPLVAAPTFDLTGNPVGFTVNSFVSGAPSLSVYWLKDGVPLQDGAQFTGTQTTSLFAPSVTLADAGNYQLVASNIFGVTTSAATFLSVYCVDANGANPQPPYSSWATAATNIQEAVSQIGGAADIVLVTNGVYGYGTQSEDGGLSSNRVTLNKPMRVQSVNGPFVTTILGNGETNGPSAVRCAWLTNNAILIGFTLKEGATASSGSTTVQETGGGVWCAASSNCFIDNCVLVSNTAYGNGAAAYQGTLVNCLVTSNSAGGGSPALYGTFGNNCTIVSNTTYTGVAYGSMTNCIVYYNRAGSFGAEASGAYCCTFPAGSGPGNFTNSPDLAPDNVHLDFGSPCIGAGTNVTVGTDIFGQHWANPPSVGCAEFVSTPSVSQPQITLTGNGFQIGNINVGGLPPFGFLWLENGVPVNGGNFSGSQSSNLVITGVNLAEAGSYQLVVTNASGSVTSAAVQLNIHTVNAAGTNPQPPYLTWATAATNIQDAIEASAPGDIVLVTNGVYDSGGIANNGLTNRITLDRAILVTSVNGFRSTIIQGAFDPISTNGPAAVRCAWLTNNAILSGFTLENGATLNTGDDNSLQSGGGVFCDSTNALVSNCLLTNNFAAFYGGGICSGTLDNSLVLGNEASSGGGTYNANLNNCTVEENFATNHSTGQGGGTYGGRIRNSIVIGNYLGFPTDFFFMSNYGTEPNYAYCCTENIYAPIPSGPGNTEADPDLLDWYHISIYSACRGAGSSLYASGMDIDGEPWNNPPSIGCDEVVVSDRVGPLSVSVLALETNLLVSSPMVPHFDSFFGQVSGLASYLTWSFGDGSVITNASDSCLHSWTNTGDYSVVLTAYNFDHPTGVSNSQLVHVVPINPPNLPVPTIVGDAIEFQFPTQWGGNYYVQYATNLAPPVTWTTLESDYSSFGNTVVVQDSATNQARFYRVLVQ